MSLDTVLKIGNVLRNSDKSLKYFKYVQPCPKDKKGNYPLCLSFKVDDDFSIDFNSVSMVPENQMDKLYYLTFKTSDSDGLVKYIYGDIFYETVGTVKNSSPVVTEKGYYRLPNPNNAKAYQSGSFERGKADYNSIIQKHKVSSLYNDTKNKVADLECIREKMAQSIATIETILRYVSAVEYYFDNKITIPFANFLNNEENLYDITVKNNYKKISKQSLAKLKITEFPESDIIERRKIFDMPDNRIFLHFDYNGKHWYELKDCFEAVSEKMTEEFVEESKDGGLVLKKSLYKNLCSGDTKNDIQFPNFSQKGKNKAKSFSDEEISSLFYAASYTSKGKSIYKTDIKLIVLPSGDNLTEVDYADFLAKNNETAIVTANNEYSDSLFDFAESNNKEITVFDLILCKKGGMTSPDSDLVEISGIEKSKLRQINERISEIAHTVYQERKNEINTEKDLLPLSIEYSFLNILGNPFYDEKTKKLKIVENPKYQSHLLKVLPLIYLENYVNDNVLLPAFIQNVESSIRSGDNKFAFLKYDLKFLYGIQNSKSRYMEITQSESYGIGLLLGSLAKNLSLEINSFEKNYVGNLTRRISTMDDFIRLKNDIEQKLIMHDKSKFTFKTSYELAQKVKEFKSQYDKDECAFGFLESYFKPIPKSENK